MADNRAIVQFIHRITIWVMKKQISLVIIDDRPLIVQALRQQIQAAPDMMLAHEGYAGDYILIVAEVVKPDIFIINIDIPQAENNDIIRFQPIPTLRILRRRCPQTHIILLANKHLPVLAHLVDHLGAEGYILLQDARMADMPNVIRHVAVGRKVYSTPVQEDRFYLALQKKGLSDTQINILGAAAVDPNLSYQQIANLLGISHGTLRNALSQLFQVFNVRNLTAALLATHAIGIDHFQLRLPGREVETGVGLFGRTAHPHLQKQAVPNVASL